MKVCIFDRYSSVCIITFLKYDKKKNNINFVENVEIPVFLYFADYFEANKKVFTFDLLQYKLNHLNPITTKNHL